MAKVEQVLKDFANYEEYEKLLRAKSKDDSIALIPRVAAGVRVEPRRIYFRCASVPIQKFLSSLSVDVEGAAAEALDGRQDIVG